MELFQILDHLPQSIVRFLDWPASSARRLTSPVRQ
jgi:hypothetical protein